ncbi:protein of unknown function [Streptomyces sp. KY70]|nr:protein of unknown function [Streptomyces sp. KY70]
MPVRFPRVCRSRLLCYWKGLCSSRTGRCPSPMYGCRGLWFPGAVRWIDWMAARSLSPDAPDGWAAQVVSEAGLESVELPPRPLTEIHAGVARRSSGPPPPGRPRAHHRSR